MPGAKSATAAGLLGIFLGAWGVHHFYLGHIKFAIIHLVLGGGGMLLAIIAGVLAASQTSIYGALSGGMAASWGFAAIATPLAMILICGSSIWGLVEGIIILTKPQSGMFSQDGHGNRLA